MLKKQSRIKQLKKARKKFCLDKPKPEKIRKIMDIETSTQV